MAYQERTCQYGCNFKEWDGESPICKPCRTWISRRAGKESMKKAGMKRVQVYVPAEILTKIDSMCKNGPRKISRNLWMMELILKELGVARKNDLFGMKADEIEW